LVFLGKRSEELKCLAKKSKFVNFGFTELEIGFSDFAKAPSDFFDVPDRREGMGSDPAFCIISRFVNPLDDPTQS